jgi:hypothetical protein
VAALVARLDQAPETRAPSPSLPDLVGDYARRCAAPGDASRTIRPCQRGEMRAEPGGRRQPLAAEQTVGVREPGFVWLARTSVAPFLHAHVLDAYVGGQGVLEARLFGSLRVARMTGPQLGRGELMRYLAEPPWAPQAMLHNPHLRWRQAGPDAAEVSAASDGAGPARVRFTFEGGDIVRAEADDPPRTVGRRRVPTRWQGRFSGHRELGGCRIPTRAEVSWMLDDGPFACWRGEVTAYAAR